MRPALIPLRRVRTGALAAALLALGGCVSIPTGPSVATFPGTGRSFDQFRADEADCRRHASDSIGGSDPSRAQALGKTAAATMPLQQLFRSNPSGCTTHIDFDVVYMCSTVLSSLRSFDIVAGETYLIK